MADPQSRIQIAVQTMTGYEDTLRLAQWCESNGVAALAVADHYLGGPDRTLPALDQLVVLGGIARETAKLELCTLVSPVTFRHPAVHLKAAVTLDEMSGGRFTLGVGTGWMPEEHSAFGLEFYSMTERFERLEQTLQYLRAATSGDGDGFEGSHYRLDPFTPEPRPHRLRIVVGGAGEYKTPALAGRFADEYNIFPTDQRWAPRIERATAAAVEAGPGGAALFLSTAFPPLAGEDDSEYRDVLTESARSRDQAPDSLQQRATALAVPQGTIDQVATGLEILAKAGISRVYLQLGSDGDQAIRQTDLFIRAAASLT